MISSLCSRSPLTLAILCTACLGFGLCLAPSPAQAQDIFTVTFDDKPIDEPIGTSGVHAGEPSWLDSDRLEAIVRSAPFVTPSLEISNTSLSGQMGFQLPTVIATGVVALVTDVWLYEGSLCTTGILFLSSIGQVLTMVEFREDGTLLIGDAGGVFVQDVPYATGRSIPVLIVVDFENRIYSAWVDSVPQVVDHPVYSEIQDLRQVIIRSGYDCPEGNRFSIDQLRLLAHEPHVPVESMSWGSIRALYR